MSETTMPAAEAASADVNETFAYELAFHVLPTVAEGEVANVADEIKALVTKAGGEIVLEEAPERFDLAYEIVKHLEGKNRKFSSAYFGWVRFTAESTAVTEMSEAMEERGDILRHLLVRLTREEEAHPFYFHEALASQKMVTDVEEAEVAKPVAEEVKSEDNEETTAEESAAEAPKEESEAETEAK